MTTDSPPATIEQADAGSILFAGGGSGGHISPGLAIAEQLDETSRCRDHASPEILFVCSERPIDAEMCTTAGVDHRPIPARPVTTHPLRAASFVRGFHRSKRMCRAIFRERSVAQVVALGGFVAAPAVAAARAEGIPVTLINLDDPPGRANRWMARRCTQVWTAIDLPSRPRFAQRVVGLPIRRRALASGDRRQCRTALGLDPGTPTLLVTGASQGAASINRFLAAFAATSGEALDGWQVYHLTGRGGDGGVGAAYRKAGVAAVVEPFLDEIGLAWGAADLAVSRAGANTVAEVAANAVPTLFLPYPHHRDAHQRNNARPLLELDAAVIADDRIDARANVEHVGPVLRGLLSDPARREAVRRRLGENPPPDAARVIATLLAGREA